MSDNNSIPDGKPDDVVMQDDTSGPSKDNKFDKDNQIPEERKQEDGYDQVMNNLALAEKEKKSQINKPITSSQKKPEGNKTNPIVPSGASKNTVEP